MDSYDINEMGIDPPEEMMNEIESCNICIHEKPNKESCNTCTYGTQIEWYYDDWLEEQNDKQRTI